MPFPSQVPSILRDYGPKQETWGLQTGAVAGLALHVRLTASGDVLPWVRGGRTGLPSVSRPDCVLRGKEPEASSA